VHARTRVVSAVGAVLLCAVSASAGSPAAAAPGDGCSTEQRVEGPFRSVAKPADLLPGPLVAHAVEPADPRTVYLADASAVAVSTDAGCTWSALPLPAAPGTTITSLTVPDTQEASGRLLVVRTAPTSPPNGYGTSTVTVRADGAGPFRQSAPQPAVLSLAVSPVDPGVVYLATAVGVLRSTDGGLSYLPTTGLRTSTNRQGATSRETAAETVAVDPTTGDRLAVGSTSLQVSEDRGATYRPVLQGEAINNARLLAAHPGGGPAAGTFVVIATPPHSTASLGKGQGRQWSVPVTGDPVALPDGPLTGEPRSLALGRGADEIVLTTEEGGDVSNRYEGPGTLYLYDAPGQTWVDVAVDRGHPLRQAQVDRTDDPAVHLHSSTSSSPRGSDEYVVYSPPARGRVVPPTVDDGSGGGSDAGSGAVDEALPGVPRLAACPESGAFEPPQARASSARLTPARSQVTAAADGRARQDLRLDLPGDALALDLFVVLDTSRSLEPAAAGLACGVEELVTGLAADGIDVHVGLAEFWDENPRERYRRLVDVGPPGLPLQRTLRTLRNRGGQLETHRTALYQSVTGEGLTVGGREHVAPGQGATFRPGSARMLLMISDEPWRETLGEPSPFVVIDAMNAAGAQHVGLQLLHEVGTELWATGPGPGGQELLRVQMDQFSAGTGALAPAGGVDCDGDGAADLSEGEPLVCTRLIDGEAIPLAGAVRSLADALRPRGQVRLEPRPAPGVEATVGRSFDDVDLREGGRFDFPVTAQCAPEVRGPVEVELDAVAGAARVATASLTVLCGAATAAPHVPAEPAQGAPPALAPVTPDGATPALAAAPPAAPPPVVQIPAPAPAPAPAPGLAPGAAAAGASAGAAAGAGTASAAGASAAGTSAAGSGAPGSGTVPSTSAGLAGAPQAPQRRAQVAFVSTSSDVPLAAVPLGGAALATAAAATHLLVTRRSAGAPAAVRAGRRRWTDD